MNMIKLINIILPAFVLMSCIGVNLGGDTTEGGNESKVQTANSPSGSEDPASTDNISAAYVGETVDLLPYVVFKVNNAVGGDLSGLWADIASGESRKVFSSVSLKLASESGLLIKLPTNITDNSLFVTLKGESGQTFNETHLIPLVNCGAVDSNCNKVIVEIDNYKYQGLQ